MPAKANAAGSPTPSPPSRRRGKPGKEGSPHRYLPGDAGDESHLPAVHLLAVVSRCRGAGTRLRRRLCRHPPGDDDDDGRGPGAEITRGGGAAAGNGLTALGAGTERRTLCRPERGSHMGCRHPRATAAAPAAAAAFPRSPPAGDSRPAPPRGGRRCSPAAAGPASAQAHCTRRAAQARAPLQPRLPAPRPAPPLPRGQSEAPTLP